MPSGDLRRELRALLGLAWPVILSQLGLMAMGVVDIMMVGHLGKLELGAVAIAHTYCFGVLIIPLGILMGLDPLVSQAWGAERREAVGRAMITGWVLAVLLAVPTILAWLVAGPALRALRQPAEIIPMAHEYALWLTPGVLPILCFQAQRKTLEGIGAVRPVMAVALACNVFNLVADWALIYGHLGFPAMGVRGAGIATSLSRWFLFGGLLIVMFRGGYLSECWPDRIRVRLRAIRQLFVTGVPIGIQYGLEVWLFSLVGFMMGQLGTVAVAGHQIALNLASLAFMMPMGLSVAASVRVGHAIGRRDSAGVRRAAWVSVSMGVAVMTVSATLFSTIPTALAGLYTRDTEVIALAALVLPIAALFQLVDGLQAVGFGVLRGANDTRVPMLFNLVGYYGIALPLGWWLTFERGVGPRGLWIAMAVGLGLVAMAITARIWFRLRRDLEPIVVVE